jgi:hypothetical protein
MVLNSNESRSSVSLLTLPLRTLEEILYNRIIQKKGEMHPSHNGAYNDSLCTGIETIQWVLVQILMLLQSTVLRNDIETFLDFQNILDNKSHNV